MGENLKPMLARTGTKRDLRNEGFIFEPKLDGTRALLFKEGQQISLVNRRNRALNHRYPELMELAGNIDSNAVLDGEIITLDENGRVDFYRLAEREQADNTFRIELLSRRMPATYVVFDILEKNGKSLAEIPLLERKKILKETVTESKRINLCFYTEDGPTLYESAKKLELEGVMAKKSDSAYESGKRSANWLKIKFLQTMDTVIIGYSTGTGKRGETFGSIITACYYNGKLRYVGKVGSGFDEQLLESLLKRLEKIRADKCPVTPEPDLKLLNNRKPIWVRPELVCEVRFMNLSKDLLMRAPVYVRLREDKAPEECVLER